MFAVSELELILINIPIIITSLAAAIASIISAKHGTTNKEKLDEVIKTQEKEENGPSKN